MSSPIPVPIPVPSPCCHLSFPCRLQSGMNLQICFVNDSGSDKDSDADDSKTETSLDTPLSPMVGLGEPLTGVWGTKTLTPSLMGTRGEPSLLKQQH